MRASHIMRKHTQVRFILSLDGIRGARYTHGEHAAFMQAASAEAAYLRNKLKYFEDKHQSSEYVNVTQGPTGGLHLPQTGHW
jgi:hypothetical protein